MTLPRAMSLLAKGVLMLGALVAGTLVTMRLERDRPRMLLERAHVEIGENLDGTPWLVQFPQGAASDALLLQVARFGRLRTIVLKGGEVGPEGLRALRSIKDLHRLDLKSCAGTPECLREIGLLTSLRELSLRDCDWVTDQGISQLQPLGRLETLDLSGTRVSDAGVAHLIRLPRLFSLNLSPCPGVTDVGLQKLAAMKPLVALTCSGAGISRRGALSFLRGRPERVLITDTFSVPDLQPLLDAGAMISLDARYEVSTIHVDGTQRIGSVRWPYPGPTAVLSESAPLASHRRSDPPFDQALTLLADCSELRDFSVRNVAIADEGLAPLGRLSALVWFNIENCPIRGAGLRFLQGHHDLRYVTIGSPVLTNEALHQVGKLTHLQTLMLQGPPQQDGTLPQSRIEINDDGLAQLQGLTQLVSLSLVRLPLTGAGLEHLQLLPRLQLLELDLDGWEQESFRLVARLPALEQISFSGPITAGGIQYLAEAPSLSRLELRHAFLDEDDGRALATLPKMTSLELIDTQASSETLRLLAAAPALRTLCLVDTDCVEADIQKIRSSRPGFQVYVVHAP